MIQSPSGDIDILALFVAHDFGGVRVLIDNGTGKARKTIDVTPSTLDLNKKKAVIGIHAFPAMITFLVSSRKVRWRSRKQS